jgi:hypothetical protein
MFSRRVFIFSRLFLDSKTWSSTREKLKPVNPCIRPNGALSGTDFRIPNLVGSLD